MFVIQFKCNTWCNAYRYNMKVKQSYETVEDAEEALKGFKMMRTTEYRIAEHLGGRKYKEVKRITK